MNTSDVERLLERLLKQDAVSNEMRDQIRRLVMSKDPSIDHDLTSYTRLIWAVLMDIKASWSAHKTVSQDIFAERIYQLIHSGDGDHDNGRTPRQWLETIESYTDDITADDPAIRRAAFVKIAATAMAALEATERKSATEPWFRIRGVVSQAHSTLLHWIKQKENDVSR